MSSQASVARHPSWTPAYRTNNVAQPCARTSLSRRRLPLSLLLIQVVIILALSRLIGSIVSTIGQPRVIGEMIAGLVLGPSCLGWLLPRWSATLFDPSTLGPLNVLSQLGLV